MTVFNRQKWFFPFPNPFSIYLFSKVWCVGSPPPCVCECGLTPVLFVSFVYPGVLWSSACVCVRARAVCLSVYGRGLTQLTIYWSKVTVLYNLVVGAR